MGIYPYCCNWEVEVVESLEFYKEMFGDTVDTELTYYKTYLIQTDYVVAKIAEANYLGVEVGSEDKVRYDEILQQRALARVKINELESTDLTEVQNG